MKPYIDNNVVSTYVAKPPTTRGAAAQWESVRYLMHLANSREIRFISSSYLVDESRRGDPSAARRRLNALREITIRKETKHIRIVAEEILDNTDGARSRKKLSGDARHLAAAITFGSTLLITWDSEDFEYLVESADKLGLKCPSIIDPDEAVARLSTFIKPNPRRHPNKLTPWIRGIIRETKRIQIEINKEQGFPSSAPSRRGPRRHRR